MQGGFVYTGFKTSAIDEQPYYSTERSRSSPTERSGSSISPQYPSSPSSWWSQPPPNAQQPIVAQKEDDISAGALARAFKPLSLDSKGDFTATHRDVHQRVKPTDPDVFNPESRLVGTTLTQPRGTIKESRSSEKNYMTHREEERLNARFKHSKKPRKFFVVGKVFLVLWVEPAGDWNKSDITNTSAATSITKGLFGEAVFSKVRRFVVVREDDRHCIALPVMTYGGQGVSKNGVTKSDHAIIYTGRTAPLETPAEASIRGEEGLRPRAIRVDGDSNEDILDVMSRIDFGKAHTIHHNLKVRSFGKVNRESLPHLIYQFDAVWAKAKHSFAEKEKLQHHKATPRAAIERKKDSSGDIWKDAYDSLILQGYSHDRAIEFLPQKASASTEEPPTIPPGPLDSNNA